MWVPKKTYFFTSVLGILPKILIFPSASIIEAPRYEFICWCEKKICFCKLYLLLNETVLFFLNLAKNGKTSNSGNGQHHFFRRIFHDTNRFHTVFHPFLKNFVFFLKSLRIHNCILACKTQNPIFAKNLICGRKRLFQNKKLFSHQYERILPHLLKMSNQAKSI